MEDNAIRVLREYNRITHPETFGTNTTNLPAGRQVVITNIRSYNRVTYFITPPKEEKKGIGRKRGKTLPCLIRYRRAKANALFLKRNNNIFLAEHIKEVRYDEREEKKGRRGNRF